MRRYALLGLALGLLTSAARSSFHYLTWGVQGDFLLELGFLLFLTGLYRPWAAGSMPGGGALLAGFLPLVAPAAVLLADGRALPGGAVLALAAAGWGLLNFILGRSLAHPAPPAGETGRAAWVGFLAAAGLGILAAGAGLPIVGLTALAAMASLLLLARPEAGRGAVRVAAAAAVLALLAGGILYAPHLRSSARRSARVWYADGPAWITSTGRSIRTTVLEGGLTSWTWFEGEVGKPRMHRRLRPSAAVAEALSREGPALIVGPLAGLEALKFDLGRPGESTMLIEDGRSAWWFNKAVADGAGRPAAPVEVGSLRRHLGRRPGFYRVIYYADGHADKALAAGDGSRLPAYDLTAESLRASILALRGDGYLVMDVPYSLKIVAALRSLEGEMGFRTAGNLMVWGSARTRRDVLVFSRAPVDPALRRRFSRLASAMKLADWYYPGRRPFDNNILRLAVTEHPRGLYAAGVEEFTPPTDDRPFFFQIQKFFPRTAAGEYIGLSPPQTRRVLGVVPPGDLPWLAFAGVCLGSWLMLFRRNRSSGAAGEWRHRLFAFFVLIGLASAMALRGGATILCRGGWNPALFMPAVAGTVLAALAAGQAWHRRPGEAEAASLLRLARLMLPLMALPMAGGVLLRAGAGWLPGWLSLALLAPAAMGAGKVLSLGLAADRGHRSLGAARAMAVFGLGALLGLEAAGPVAFIFGLSFTLVFAWVVLLVAVRVLRRILPGSGMAGAAG